MTSEEIYDILADVVDETGEKFSKLINMLTNKITNEEHDEQDEEFIRLTEVETLLFNAYGNMIKAKEAAGYELTFPEVLLKQQYDLELSEAMEMYREYRNTEEILNDKKEEKKDE